MDECSFIAVLRFAAMASDPEALKVREWRHRLQKTFLTESKEPKPEVRIFSRLFSVAFVGFRVLMVTHDILGHPSAHIGHAWV